MSDDVFVPAAMSALAWAPERITRAFGAEAPPAWPDRAASGPPSPA